MSSQFSALEGLADQGERCSLIETIGVDNQLLTSDQDLREIVDPLSSLQHLVSSIQHLAPDLT